MPVQVELRERVYHFLFLRKPKPQHGHAVEYTVELLYVLANCTFLAGSICFFSSDLMVIGAILFLAGSLVFTVLSALNVCEQRAYQAHYESDAQLLSAGAAGPSSEQGTAERLLENGCYFLGSIAFVAGSMLYVHRFYAEVKDEQIGAWLFVWGSVVFTIASYANALGMPYVFSQQHWRGMTVRFPLEVKRRAYRLAATALCCAQLGSVCFVTDSYLYRPALATKCAEHDDNEVCVSSMPQGTLLYVVGSALYLVQSFLNLAACVVKDRASASARQSPGTGDEKGDA